MADRDPKPEKPYKLETIPKPWSETDIESWWLTIIDFLKSVPKYKKSMNKDKSWAQKKVINRGFEGDDATDRADTIDSILLKIAKNGPSAIFQDIVYRSTSYDYIRDLIRKVCGFPNISNKLVSYYTLKNSFNLDQDDFNTHYYNMRDIRIGCLLRKDSTIKFNGNVQLEDEELTPALESQIVADWLESIGGVRLIKFVFQEYSRELESCTIFDLQEMLGKKENMTAILEKMEVEEVSKLNRIDNRKDDQMKSNFCFKNTNSMKQTRHCYICEENGKRFDSHDTKYCWKRNENKKKGKASEYKRQAKLRAAYIDEESHTSSSSEDEDEIVRSLIKKLNMKSRNKMKSTEESD